MSAVSMERVGGSLSEEVVDEEIGSLEGRTITKDKGCCKTMSAPARATQISITLLSEIAGGVVMKSYFADDVSEALYVGIGLGIVGVVNYVAWQCLGPDKTYEDNLQQEVRLRLTQAQNINTRKIQLEKENAQLKELKALLEGFSKSNRKLKKIIPEISTLLLDGEKTYQERMKELQKADATLGKLGKENAQLKETVQTLSKAIESLGESAQKLVRKAQKALEFEKGEKKEITDLQALAEQVKPSSKKFREEVAALNENLQEVLGETEAIINGIKELKDAEKNRNEALDHANDITDDLDDEKKDMAQRERERKAFKEEKEQLETLLKAEREKVAEISKKAEETHQAYENLITRLEKVLGQVGELKKENARLKGETS